MQGFASRIAGLLLLAVACLSLSAATAQPRRETPYWASIASGQAMMRTGPGRNYPGTWLYVRPDLPIRVLEIYQSWRKIQDPDGTTGWMQVSLLSDTRSALVIGTSNQPMHEKPDGNSAVRFFAEPGVVGRLTDCGAQFCRFEVGSRRGYISINTLYGLDPGETF